MTELSFPARDNYRDLTLEQSQSLKEILDKRYWDACEYVATIIADRAEILSHIRSLLGQDNG